MNDTTRRVRRFLPFAVLVLGATAGIMLAAFLLTRPDEPVGHSSPTFSVEPSASLAPSPAPSLAASEAESAAATPSPGPSFSGAPSGPAELAWTAGRAQPGTVNAVVRFGDRWIAGGSSASAVPSGQATVWASADGITWTHPVLLDPVPVQESGIWDSYAITALQEWDGALLAFGRRAYGGGDGMKPMIWRSVDGETWSVIETEDTALGEWDHLPVSACVASDGRLATHTHHGLGSRTSIVLTPDLAAWEERPITDDTFYASRLAASPDLLMVVGASEASTPQVATSSDGSAWSVVNPPTEAADLTDVAWDEAHAQFVVVGTDVGGRPFAWLTTDGSRWTPIQLSDDPVYIHRVVTADGLIVATGESGPGRQETPGDTIVWSSHDGLRWWYSTVLEGRSGAVEAATADTAILVSHREVDAESTWLSLVGTLVAAD